ncbi:hypothetical protein F5884DRAFT_771078 [Xylogone sp. PMI_703]|nr:hypothetical protein F5884DRAFT_771078 [Xylogone sp. PMI_703]
MSSTEGLQIAQVLADLSDLQVTEPTAAMALLTAPQNLTEKILRRKAKNPLSDPPKFDKLGRRIVGPVSVSPSPRPMHSGYSTPVRPGLMRASSSVSSLGGTRTPSGVETPPAHEVDEDIERAETLIRLYELRGRFKQQEATGLLRAQERVEAVAVKYQSKDVASGH